MTQPLVETLHHDRVGALLRTKLDRRTTWAEERVLDIRSDDKTGFEMMGRRQNLGDFKQVRTNGEDLPVIFIGIDIANWRGEGNAALGRCAASQADQDLLEFLLCGEGQKIACPEIRRLLRVAQAFRQVRDA